MSWHGRGLLAVGPFGNWVKYVYDDEPVVLAPEHDCVRVFTDERQEILQSVPKDTALIRAIGFDAPAAMLFELAVSPPAWVHALIWLPTILIFCMMLLRPFKAILFALQWHNKAEEARWEDPASE